MNFKEIIEAWIIAGNPTYAQKELAEKRGTICDDCPSKIFTLPGKRGAVCKECGCPIAKKIFTNSFNPCDLKKWKDVDIHYFPKEKDIKTLF